MIIYELRKIFFNKPVIFSIFLLLVLYSVVCYIQTTISENAIPPDTLEEFFHLYSTNTDEMDQEYHQLIDFIDSQEAIWVEQMQNGNTDFEPDKWINRYAPDGFTDIQLFREVFGKANYIQNYSAEIERVIKNSYSHLATLKSNGTLENNFDFQYQSHIISLYSTAHTEVTIFLENIRGWDIYFNYDIICIFIFTSLIVVSAFVFTNDYYLDSISLFRTTKKGRLSLGIGKTIALYVFSVLITCTFIIITLLIIYTTNGFSSTDNAIQSIGSFLYCPYIITIGEYFWIDLLFKIIASLLFSSSIMLISILLPNYAITYLCGIVFLGIHYLCYILNIPYSTNFFKPLNLMAISTARPIFERYRAINFGENCIGYVEFIIFSFFCIISFHSIISSIFSSRPCTKKRKQNAFQSKKLININQIIPTTNSHYSLSIFNFELFKTVISSKTILIIIILLIVKIFSTYSQYESVHSFSDEIYQEYMTTLSGPLTESKRDYINQERTSINTTLGAYDETRQLYIDNMMSLEDYRDFLVKHNYAYSRNEIFSNIELHLDYIDKLHSEGKDAWFVYDTGWIKLFCSDFDWSLYVLIVLISATSFSIEYNQRSSQGKFSNILRSTKFGRNKVFKSKLFCTIFLSILLFIIWSSTDLYIITSVYTFQEFNAPIYSIESFANFTIPLSIAQYFFIYYITKFFSVIILSTFVFSVAEFFSRSIVTITLSVIVTLFPRLLSILGVSIMNLFDFINFFQSTPIWLNIIEASIYVGTLICVCIGLFLLARRKWCK